MLTRREFEIFRDVAAALAGATADDALADGALQAHRVQDAAMRHVDEYRIRLRAHRMRVKKNAARARKRARSAR